MNSTQSHCGIQYCYGVVSNRCDRDKGHKGPCSGNLPKGVYRKIVRIEKVADRMSWYELLSCGHKAGRAEGPQRHYIAQPGQPKRRLCRECGEK